MSGLPPPRIFAEDGIATPEFKTDGSMGVDLAASEQTTVPPDGKVVLVPTGIYMGMHRGMGALLIGRSSNSRIGLKIDIGAIDADYRGEIKIMAWQHGPAPLVIERKQRIAQLIFVSVETQDLICVPSKDDLDCKPLAGRSDRRKVRGTGGFGSTGK